MYNIGDIVNTRCGDLEVISINGWRDIGVKFVKTGYITTTSSSDLTKGYVKDYLSPTLFGVGILGRKLSQDDKEAYNLWKSMLTRTQQKGKYPAYTDVIVSEDFLKFPLFKEWFDKNKPNFAFTTFQKRHLPDDFVHLKNRVNVQSNYCEGRNK